MAGSVGDRKPGGHLVLNVAALPALTGNHSLLGGELFVCDRLEDVGGVSPEGDRAPFTVLAGPRVGIDYAEEAVDFPWRYRIAP